MDAQAVRWDVEKGEPVASTVLAGPALDLAVHPRSKCVGFGALIAGSRAYALVHVCCTAAMRSHARAPPQDRRDRVHHRPGPATARLWRLLCNLQDPNPGMQARGTYHVPCAKQRRLSHARMRRSGPPSSPPTG